MGRWTVGHGQAQLNFLVANGMLPEHRLLDVGCGSFRAGMHFVDYLCLYRVAKIMRLGAAFYATFFEQGSTQAIDYIWLPKQAKQRFTEHNVFWYYRTDLEWAASFAPWRVRYIGDWGHPAGQRMIEFIRTTARGPRAGVAQTRTQRFVARGRRWAARRIAP